MMFEDITLKIIISTTIIVISTILAYLSIPVEPFSLFAILLIIDYVTGLMKARAIGHSITSNKMKYGMVSKFSILIIPIVLAMCAKGIGADYYYILLVGMWILILSEGYSIIGNIYSIRTGDDFPEYDAVATIGKLIRNLLLRLSGDKDI